MLRVKGHFLKLHSGAKSRSYFKVKGQNNEIFKVFFFSKIIIRITKRGVGSFWIMERSVYLGSWFWWLLWPFHSKVKVISSSKSKKKNLLINSFFFLHKSEMSSRQKIILKKSQHFKEKKIILLIIIKEFK